LHIFAAFHAVFEFFVVVALAGNGRRATACFIASVNSRFLGLSRLQFGTGFGFVLSPNFGVTIFERLDLCVATDVESRRSDFENANAEKSDNNRFHFG